MDGESPREATAFDPAWKAPGLKRLLPHDLRHTTATQLYDHDYKIEEIAKILGDIVGTMARRGLCSWNVQASSRAEGDGLLVAMLVLWQGEGPGREADRRAGHLYLQRVCRPLQRDHRERTGTESVDAGEGAPSSPTTSPSTNSVPSVLGGQFGGRLPAPTA